MIFIVPQINFEENVVLEPQIDYIRMLDFYNSWREEKEYWSVVDHTKIQVEVTLHILIFLAMNNLIR